MLQRIQSFWLFFAAACAVLTFIYPFATGFGALQGQPKAFVTLTASYDALNLLFTVLLAAGSLFLIFYYKKRVLQFACTIFLIILSIANIIKYFVETQKLVTGSYALSSLLSVAIPLFLILAARGIRRDQKLIKSLDRLR
jgi:hypothetical protein